MSRMPAGFAFTRCADQMARYWNRPERREISTRIIMPVRRPIVSQSMPLTASAWSSAPKMITIAAPISATTARLARPAMMNA
ncbi:MAG TPA: hypothetical protein VNW48_00140 [Xanthobacteraceae bacterium]|nr:hypothetical protein [Xanthobacteraceae bacterium]